jgi:hypothetical protein
MQSFSDGGWGAGVGAQKSVVGRGQSPSANFVKNLRYGPSLFDCASAWLFVMKSVTGDSDLINVRFGSFFRLCSHELGCRDQVMRGHANDASMGAVDVCYEEECNRCNYRQDQKREHAGTPLSIPH